MTRFTHIAAAVAASFTLVGTANAATQEGAASICDDGWSMTDVDDNGYVSKIEMNAYAEAQASQMDADKSGTISKDEYVNCSMRAREQQAMSGTRDEATMTKLDADGDGTVTQAEFMKAGIGAHEAVKSGDSTATDMGLNMIYVLEAQPIPDMTAISLDEFAARAALLFAALDSDRNEGLSKEEFMAKVPPMTDISEVLNRDFDTADTDKSGDLTTTELIAANAARADRAMKKSEEDSGTVANPEKGAPVVYFRFDQPT